MTLGGIVMELRAPDRHGRLDDITLGFNSLAPYLAGHPYFGAITGRVCNRVANGQFTLDGCQYTLAQNNGAHHLHGGMVGFDKRVWKAESFDGSSLKLSYTSAHMEEGYPGNLYSTVTYTLSADNEWRIDYLATSDRPTIVNLTNHTYWNLRGESSGESILDHVLTLNADRYLPVNRTLIPTGEIVSVKGTPFDFTQPTPIERGIHQVSGDPPGYDHNFVLNGRPGELKFCARIFEPVSGRMLEIHTTEPGVQLYTGNFLDGTLVGKGHQPYARWSGLCLETQHFPDSIHHPHFPSIVLRSGETFRSTSTFRFSVK